MIGSALLRRYIGRQFITLRKTAELTQDEAADALQRSRATIGRIEDGDERVRFRDIDVAAMLRLYNASDKDSELLMALTAETRNGRKSWWHDYTQSALPDWFGLYLTLEDSAETICQYEPELVPGLLQIPSYHEHVNRALQGYFSEEDILRAVDARSKRQSLLSRPRAPHLHVILNEAVLQRPVGGPTVMAEQLNRLLEAMQQTSIDIRVLPYEAGAHAGMAASGAFSLLDFPTDPHSGDVLEPPLAYVDTLTGAMYLNKPDEIRAYRLVWEDLDRRALDEDASNAKIATALKGLTNG